MLSAAVRLSTSLALATLCSSAFAETSEALCSLSQNNIQNACEGPYGSPSICLLAKNAYENIRQDCEGAPSSAQTSPGADYSQQERERLARQRAEIEARNRKLDAQRDEYQRQQMAIAAQNQRNIEQYNQQHYGVPQSASSSSTGSGYSSGSPSRTAPSSGGGRAGTPINENGEECLQAQVTTKRCTASGGGSQSCFDVSFRNICSSSIFFQWYWVGKQSPVCTASSKCGDTIGPNRLSTTHVGCSQSGGCDGTVRAGARWED